MRLAIWMLRGKASALLLGLFAGHRATVPNGPGAKHREQARFCLSCLRRDTQRPCGLGCDFSQPAQLPYREMSLITPILQVSGSGQARL
jgi:hypothetical protein